MMIEVIRRITKEKPNGHSYIHSSVLTKTVNPQEESLVPGVTNGCNIIKSACSCQTGDTLNDNNTLNECCTYDAKYEILNFTLTSLNKLHITKTENSDSYEHIGH
jgi:hypothetical protein